MYIYKLHIQIICIYSINQTTNLKTEQNYKIELNLSKYLDIDFDINETFTAKGTENVEAAVGLFVVNLRPSNI